MSTPPNPPSNTPGPSTEPAGTPVPEAASIPEAAPAPAAAQPPSPEKAPPPAGAPSLEKVPTPAAAPSPAKGPSLEKAPAPADAPPAAATPADAPPAASAPQAPAPSGPPAPAPAPAPAPSPFAPLTPAPAPPAGAGFGGPGGPGVPNNPWAQPGAGFGGVPYPTYPQAAPTTNGLAIAALVLGILGILGGVTPFLFWAGALLGLTGFGLGIAGLVKANKGAPRKAMAVTGMVLGFLSLGAMAGGIYFTAAIVKEVERREDEDLAELDIDPPYSPSSPSYPGYPTPKPKPSPSDIPGKTSALPWGSTFTYPDGVEITVQEATAYTVGKTAYPQNRTGRGVKVTVKITNRSDAPIDVTTALPHARDDKGTESEMVFDGSLPKLFKGSVLPGESATGGFVFDVAKDSKNLHFEISPGITNDYDDAIWSGPIG
ncbi:DUF4352 domain-containing protein [Streptomyces sp. NPDC058646]|uniref:DUF4352 domain-containing protein n=1 Tax=Streptomyces sp. NPDC058646 TaxID=3346574 RepID=UPI00364811C3